MAIKNRAPTLWSMLLLLLVLFTTTTFSREVTQDISVHDFQNGLQAAANGTFKLPEQSFGLPDAFERVGEPEIPTPFTIARDKGFCQLGRLSKTENEQQSPFVDREALYDNGWVNWRLFSPADRAPSRVPQLNDELDDGGVSTAFEGLGISTAPEDNPYYARQHAGGSGETKLDYPGITKGQKYGKSKGSYMNHFNVAAGMILCGYNYGPAYMIAQHPDEPERKPAPPLSQLSDILWFQWSFAVRAKKGDIKNIKYFLRSDVRDQTSKVIMDAVAEMEHQLLAEYPRRDILNDGG
ncbi:hypothetical protein LTS10_009334 [Elasticomyces elasticus]|nr:hypothetical protein LTS10_009334 [Elasticomyces elasticus]